MPNSKSQMASASVPVSAGRNRRRVQRQPFSGKATIGYADGCDRPAQIRNISPFGCNVQTTPDWLVVGRFVSLKIDGQLDIMAVVRWTRNESAGLEFFRPIELNEVEWLESGSD